MTDDFVKIMIMPQICGLYGIKDEHLVEPTNPACDLIIVFYLGMIQENKYMYNIEADSFSEILSDCIKPYSDCNLDFYRKMILEYLDSDKVSINKGHKHGFFFYFQKKMLDKLGIPKKMLGA